MHSELTDFSEYHRKPSRTVDKMTSTNLIDFKKEYCQMMEIWPSILENLTGSVDYCEFPESTEWMKKALEYLVLNDRLNRGLLVVYSYRKLAKQEQLTDEKLKLARILGWCAELCEAAFVLQDDMIDQQTMRRGKPLWPLHENLGLAAINDTLALEQGVYKLLAQYFKQEPCYVELLEFFHEFTMITALGQTLDILSDLKEDKNFDLFTIDRFDACVKHKDICAAGPVVVAMYLAGINDPELHRQARNILQQIGHLCQVQNDYLDCYGDLSVTRKVSNDIQMGKASWLAVTALERVTPEQKKIFMECYGDSDPTKVARVKALYDELSLPVAYAEYEKKIYHRITTDIGQLSEDLPRDLFLGYLHQVYRQDYL